MSARGANIGGAISQGMGRYGELLMQLIMRKDRQGQFDAASSQEQTRYDEGLKWRGERAAAEDADRVARTARESATDQRSAIENNWQPLSNLTRPLRGDIGPMGIPGPGLDPRAASAPQTSVGGERMAYMPPERKPLVNLSRGGMTITGADMAAAPRLLAGLPKDVEAPMTANQREQLAIQREQLALEGRRVGVAERTAVGAQGGGIPGITKLPVEAQKAITNVASTFDALGRYEAMTKTYLDRSRRDRAAGQIGFADKDRDAALGGLKAAQQTLKLNIKNVGELGVLSGPDEALVMGMIGDPTESAQLARDPEYTLARFEEARAYINDKVNAYERSYGIKIPRPETLGSQGEGSAGSGRTSGAGPGQSSGAPPDLRARIQNDPSLSAEQKADLLSRIRS